MEPRADAQHVDLLRRAGVHAFVNPLQAVRAVASNVSPLAREAIAAGRRRRPGPRVVRTRFNRTVSAHRTWEEAKCTLAELKQVKHAVPGATINDVCLSVIGGAMHAYLTEIGEPPAAPLVSLVPVSTRTPDQVASGGNQISGMRVSLASDIDDPLDRLAAIAAETATKKATQNGVAMPVLLEVAQVMPGALIGAAARRRSIQWADAAAGQHGRHQRTRLAGAALLPRLPAGAQHRLRAVDGQRRAVPLRVQLLRLVHVHVHRRPRSDARPRALSRSSAGLDPTTCRRRGFVNLVEGGLG